MQVDVQTLNPGDRIWRWVSAPNGTDDMDLQPLTVVKVNPKTVTVRTDWDATMRLPHRSISGRVDWPE